MSNAILQRWGVRYAFKYNRVLHEMTHMKLTMLLEIETFFYSESEKGLLGPELFLDVLRSLLLLQVVNLNDFADEIQVESDLVKCWATDAHPEDMLMIGPDPQKYNEYIRVAISMASEKLEKQLKRILLST